MEVFPYTDRYATQYLYGEMGEPHLPVLNVWASNIVAFCPQTGLHYRQLKLEMSRNRVPYSRRSRVVIDIVKRMLLLSGFMFTRPKMYWRLLCEAIAKENSILDHVLDGGRVPYNRHFLIHNAPDEAFDFLAGYDDHPMYDGQIPRGIIYVGGKPSYTYFKHGASLDEILARGKEIVDSIRRNPLPEAKYEEDSHPPGKVVASGKSETLKNHLPEVKGFQRQPEDSSGLVWYAPSDRIGK
jgi:hypothetical protein